MGCGFASFQAAAQTPHFDPIEFPGHRELQTEVRAMSADGSAVVGRQNAFGMVWTSGGGMSNPCTALPGVPDCVVTGIAGNSLVGHTGNGGEGRIFEWEAGFGPFRPVCPNGEPTGCTTGPLASQANFFAVYDGWGWLASPALGTPSYWGPFLSPGAVESMITGISSDGMFVVGWEAYKNAGHHAFYAFNGTVCDLDPSGALGESFGAGTNPSGTVAVGFANEIATVWSGLSHKHCTGTAYRLVPGRGNGRIGGRARAVSDTGVIVGTAGRWDDPSQTPVAFRWTCENGMESIERLLVDSGAGFRHLAKLPEAVAVSSDGTVIAGNGIDTNGVQPRAWRAVLPLPATPSLQVIPDLNVSNFNMSFDGPKGGPFTNSPAQYQLRRSSPGTNFFQITGLPSWLNVSAAEGTMTNRMRPLGVRFTVKSSARKLAPGVYGPETITITFFNGKAVDPADRPYCTLRKQRLTATLTVK